MKRAPLFLLSLLALAPILAAHAEDPATRFFRSALAFARAEAAKAGAQCREPFIRKSGPEPWKDRWTGLSVVLDLPRPAGAANDDPVWDGILDLAAAHFEEEVAVLRSPKPDAVPAVVRPTGLKSGDIRVIRKTGRVAP